MTHSSHTPTDRLDEIEARANAATEGPWDAAKVYPDGPCDIVQIGHDEHGPEWASEQIADRVESLADAEFIVQARADVPALVTALRDVLEYVNELDGTLDLRSHEIRDLIASALDEARP